MKYLEQLILGACYGEVNFKKVSFLEPSDFSNKRRCELFRAIMENRGDMIEAIRNNHHLKNDMVGYSNLLGYTHPERLGLNLLEHRFKALLSTLLGKLSVSTKNSLEAAILNESLMRIPEVDIFDLSDYILEYLSHHASDNTTNRINAFLKYRDMRILKAKEVIDKL